MHLTSIPCSNRVLSLAKTLPCFHILPNLLINILKYADSEDSFSLCTFMHKGHISQSHWLEVLFFSSNKTFFFVIYNAWSADVPVRHTIICKLLRLTRFKITMNCLMPLFPLQGLLLFVGFYMYILRLSSNCNLNTGISSTYPCITDTCPFLLCSSCAFPSCPLFDYST